MLAQVNTRRMNGARAFASDERLDEVLWSAYYRCDKSAVTKALLKRYLQPPRRDRPLPRKLSYG